MLVCFAGEGAMFVSWATGNASVVDGGPRIVSKPTVASVVGACSFTINKIFLFVPSAHSLMS